MVISILLEVFNEVSHSDVHILEKIVVLMHISTGHIRSHAVGYYVSKKPVLKSHTIMLYFTNASSHQIRQKPSIRYLVIVQVMAIKCLFPLLVLKRRDSLL